jgi:hypothetical protein
MIVRPLNSESWQYRPSRLELLAIAADVPPWVVRDWLAAEVERRRAELEELPPAVGAPAGAPSQKPSSSLARCGPLPVTRLGWPTCSGRLVTDPPAASHGIS